MRSSTSRTFIAALATLSIGLAACGSDDDADVDEEPATTEAPADEVVEEPAEEPVEESAEEPADEPADDPADDDATTEEPADDAAAAETYDMSVAVSPAVTVLPQYVAMAEGFFEENGINADFVAVQNGPDYGAAMISGDITTGGNIPNNQIGLINAGFDVIAFHEIVAAQFFDILVSNDIDTSGAADWQEVMQMLEGSNVGVVANGAAAEDIARTLFSEAGVDADAQTYIATGLPDTTLAALTNGEIDMTITFDPAFVIAESQDVGYQPFSLREGDGPASVLWPSLLATASREYAEANPGALSAYSDAMVSSVEFIQDSANRDRVIEIMTEDMGFNAELAGPMLDANVDYFNPTGEFNVDQLTAAAEWVNEIGKSETVLAVEEWTIVPD